MSVLLYFQHTRSVFLFYRGSFQGPDEKSPRKSNRMAAKSQTTATASVSEKTIPQPTTPTYVSRIRKRKLPIDGDCLPSTSARSKLSVTSATVAGVKTTTTSAKDVKSTQIPTKFVLSAAVGSAPSSLSPEAGETSPRRYGLRTKAYDNLKAKLNKMSGHGTVLPLGGDVVKKVSPAPSLEAPPTKMRKRRPLGTKKTFVLKQNLKLDAVFEEVISSLSENQLEVRTLTPVEEAVSEEEEATNKENATAAEGEKTERYPESLVETLKLLHEDMEKTSSIDKLIQDVKQSLQTNQAVLSITADLEQVKDECPEVGQNETVTTTAEVVEGDIVCVPVDVPMPEVTVEETVTTTIETGPTPTTLNTFNIETGPGGEQLTVHLMEYKSVDEDLIAATSITHDAGSSSTDGTPKKKCNEKLEALKKNAEGRESFSEFLQKVITAHAENERRNQMKQTASAVSVSINDPPAQEPLSTVVAQEENSQDDEMEVIEPTRIRRKQGSSKSTRIPVHAAPNSEDYESVTEVVLGRLVAKKYRCKICSHETKFLGMMARHLHSHNSESGETKEFKCDKCDFTCIFRRRLNSHMKCHIKPFLCEFCCYRTTQQNDLQRHVWRHTGKHD
jgi:hypothetical protein